MKTRPISRRSKTLSELLELAQQEDLLLETADGQCFVLALVPVGWHGYELDETGDPTSNPALLEHLRRRRGRGGRIGLAQVKAELGLK